MTIAEPILVEENCTAYDRYKRNAEKKCRGFSLDENGHVYKGGYCYGWLYGCEGVYKVIALKARKHSPPYIGKKPEDFAPYGR